MRLILACPCGRPQPQPDPKPSEGFAIRQSRTATQPLPGAHPLLLWLLWLLGGLGGLLFFGSLLRHRHFGSNAADLGAYESVFWSLGLWPDGEADDEFVARDTEGVASSFGDGERQAAAAERLRGDPRFLIAKDEAGVLLLRRRSGEGGSR